jgi:hypothetical protein
MSTRQAASFSVLQSTSNVVFSPSVTAATAFH